MFTTLFNSHAITNRILIIVLEGTLRHTITQKQLFLGFLKQFFKFLWDFRIFESKHTKKLQNTLKTLKNSKEQHLEVMSDKPYEFASKHFGYPPTLKSNIVLNVSSIDSHK